MINQLNKIKAQAEVKMQNVHLEEDGLLHCNFCGEVREFVLQDDDFVGLAKKFVGNKLPITCTCQDPRNSAEAKDFAKRQFANKVTENRTIGLYEQGYKHYTMARDDGKNEKVSASIERYIESWQENKKANKGILFYGGVGTGKTFYAAAIANAVLDMGEKVRMLPMSALINACTNSYGEGKKNVLDWVRKCDLLIIDDFGTQRKTDTVYEIVYELIDARYQSGKPLIITTNSNLQKGADDREQRLNDRIKAMCVPFPIVGESRRKSPIEQKAFELYEELAR